MSLINDDVLLAIDREFEASHFHPPDSTSLVLDHFTPPSLEDHISTPDPLHDHSNHGHNFEISPIQNSLDNQISLQDHSSHNHLSHAHDFTPPSIDNQIPFPNHSGNYHAGHDHGVHSLPENVIPFPHSGHENHAHPSIDSLVHDDPHHDHGAGLFSDHAGHAHDSGFLSSAHALFETPGVGLLFGGLGLYSLGRHIGDKDRASALGRGTLVGYTLVDGLAHTVPSLGAIASLGVLGGPLALLGGVALGGYAFYKGYKDRKESESNGTSSGMALAGWDLLHSGYHIGIAVRGVSGFAAGAAHAPAVGGILGSLLGFIYNPIVQLGVACLSMYMLYKEYKGHRQQKERAPAYSQAA